MRKVILYIAISLDGYVAKLDGSVSWLDNVPHSNQEDYGYYSFYEAIDTTLMGNKTYQQVLGFDTPFPYSNKTNYVFTRQQELQDDENVSFINEDIGSFVRNLKHQEGADIWLIGGGQINGVLLEENLIDEMIVSIMPMILGNGLPFFSIEAKTDMERLLELKETKSFQSGVVQLRYSKMRQETKQK